MNFDIKTISELVQSSQVLVSSVRSAITSVEDAAQEVDRIRNQLSKSAILDGNGSVAVRYDDEAQQKATLARILELQAALPTAAGNPALDGALRAELADAFTDLAVAAAGNGVSKIVVFSVSDRAEIANLLQRAKLDVAKRKQQAAVLHAAVSIAEAALKVAAVVAA